MAKADFENQALTSTFRDGMAVVARKHKRRQQPIPIAPATIAQLYAVVTGELQIFKRDGWRPASAHTLTWIPRGSIYGIRQAPSYRGEVKVLIILLQPPRGWSPSFGTIPTTVPETWWRRLLDLETQADFNDFGKRVTPVRNVVHFVDSLSAATSRRARTQMAHGPKRTSTTGDWLNAWAQAQDLVNERACAGLSVDALAHSVHVSVVQLRRIYAAVDGCTPKEAIDRVRINRAKHLLSTGKHTAAQVASLVGYSTAQRFSTAFTAACGMTPGTFAKGE